MKPVPETLTQPRAYFLAQLWTPSISLFVGVKDKVAIGNNITAEGCSCIHPSL